MIGISIIIICNLLINMFFSFYIFFDKHVILIIKTRHFNSRLLASNITNLIVIIYVFSSFKYHNNSLVLYSRLNV